MNEITVVKSKIASFMFTGKIPTKFELAVIFENIELCETIVGMKFNNKYFGDIKHTTCFFNQISFNIKVHSRNGCLNVKLFGSGSFQATGARNEEEVKQCMAFLLKKVARIIGEETVSTTVFNGLRLNSQDYLEYNNKIRTRFHDKRVYSDQGEYIGTQNGELLTLFDKKTDFDPEFKVLYFTIPNSFIKKVYDYNGNIIGEINYLSPNNKTRKRVQLKKNYKTEKITDTEYKYIKTYTHQGTVYNEIVFIKKINFYDENFTIEDYYNLKKPDGSSELHRNIKAILDDNIQQKVMRHYTNDTFNFIDTVISNVNINVFYTKFENYIINPEKIIEVFEKNHGIQVFSNNTKTRYEVFNLKLFLHEDLKTIVNTANVKELPKIYHEFSIVYFYLHSKFIISGVKNLEYIEPVRDLIIKIIDDNKQYLFVQTKKFDTEQTYTKIDLKSLL